MSPPADNAPGINWDAMADQSESVSHGLGWIARRAERALTLIGPGPEFDDLCEEVKALRGNVDLAAREHGRLDDMVGFAYLTSAPPGTVWRPYRDYTQESGDDDE
jgi:hypothetical protein